MEDPAVAGNEDVMNIASAGLGDPRPGALTIEYTDGDLNRCTSVRKSGTKISDFLCHVRLSSDQ